MTVDKSFDFKEFLNISDASVKDTIEMFFKYPSGFHGDTGLQHYLYHRIFSNAEERIFWQSSNDSNIRTLLFQSEVYTECKYLKKGKSKKPGRFDMAFISPPLDKNRKSPEKLKPFIAFEVGRNKSLKIMGDINASQEADAPTPGDAAKIIRDLRFGKLKAGYILEFFDRRTPRDIQNARKVAKELGGFLERIENIKCHISICLFQPNDEPLVWLYPDSWADNLNLDYEQLSFEQPIPSLSKCKNRISHEVFFELCGDCGRSLQETIYEKYFKELRLLYGGKTMTLNQLKPKSCFLRISNKFEKKGEKIRDFSDQMKNIFVQNKIPVIDGTVTVPEEKNESLIQLILLSISKYLDQIQGKI